MKNRTIKLIATLALSVCVMATLAGCTTTTTTTNTTTDENGNTTTTTETTTTDENGNTTTETTTETSSDSDVETITADFAVNNETGIDIYAMYIVTSDAETWGDSLVDSDDPFLDGEVLTGSFNYDENNLIWDLRIEDEDGDSVEFNGIDFSYADDPENITITLYVNDEGGYSATIG